MARKAEMKTHEQLAVMAQALKDGGWVRLNGNTWEDPDHRWRVVTAYAHQEATVRLLFRRVHGQPAWVNDASRAYRGTDPLKWFMSLDPLLPADKVFWARIRK